MAKDTLPLPRSLLEADARTLWVYANLLAKADEQGVVTIKANSWCEEIGLTRQQLRSTLNELIKTNYITNSTTNCGTNGKTNLTICGKANCKPSAPIKKPIEQPIEQPIQQPIITAKTSSNNLSFVDPAFADAFTAWLDHKKKQFKFEYKTEHSLKAAYAELVKLSGNDPDIAMQIVEQSMSNGWKGLFELKNNGTYKPTSTIRDTPTTRKEQRDRGLSLANEIVSRSDNLLRLYNGSGADSDTR